MPLVSSLDHYGCCIGVWVVPLAGDVAVHRPGHEPDKLRSVGVGSSAALVVPAAGSGQFERERLWVVPAAGIGSKSVRRLHLEDWVQRISVGEPISAGVLVREVQATKDRRTVAGWRMVPEQLASVLRSPRLRASLRTRPGVRWERERRPGMVVVGSVAVDP